MVRLYTATDLVEAQLLVDRLSVDGVAATIVNENNTSLAGLNAIPTVRPEVWVEETDVPRAWGLVKDYQARRVAPEGPPRVCPRCREENPSGFEVCWKCGADLG